MGGMGRSKSGTESMGEASWTNFDRRYEQAENDGTPLEGSFEKAPIVVPKNSVLSDNRGDPPKILSTAEAALKLRILDKAIAASGDLKETGR